MKACSPYDLNNHWSSWTPQNGKDANPMDPLHIRVHYFNPHAPPFKALIMPKMCLSFTPSKISEKSELCLYGIRRWQQERLPSQPLGFDSLSCIIRSEFDKSSIQWLCNLAGRQSQQYSTMALGKYITVYWIDPFNALVPVHWIWFAAYLVNHSMSNLEDK